MAECYLQLPETGVQTPFELKTHLAEHSRQACLFQSHLLHPKSDDWALFEAEKTHYPSTISYPK